MYCQIWRLYLFNILIQYLFLFVSSSVLPRVGNLFFGFSNESLVFSERNSDSLFSKSELSPSLFFKEQRELKCHFLKKSDWAKSSSSGENYKFFSSKLLVCWEQKMESAIRFQKTSKSLTSLFVKELFALVTFLQRAMRANPSWSL